eukprot:scaffold3644_cov107-Isochrysis_galbana.AAC.4
MRGRGRGGARHKAALDLDPPKCQGYNPLSKEHSTQHTHTHTHTHSTQHTAHSAQHNTRRNGTTRGSPLLMADGEDEECLVLVLRASCANASARSANRLRVYLQTILGSKGWFSRIIMRLTILLGGLPLCRSGEEDANGLVLAGGGGEGEYEGGAVDDVLEVGVYVPRREKGGGATGSGVFPDVDASEVAECIPEIIGRAPREKVKGGGGKGGDASPPEDST